MAFKEICGNLCNQWQKNTWYLKKSVGICAVSGEKKHMVFKEICGNLCNQWQKNRWYLKKSVGICAVSGKKHMVFKEI
ncbi:hypothetical protein [Flavobacterium marginilacus]|uniref:hypothetical protein n=1 Tax=Flavobacterium marginilacus TaxID=3003256 RepID=UPI00248DFAE0|nr:hypothetical protein [Flavobacterium marginilacus]